MKTPEEWHSFILSRGHTFGVMTCADDVVAIQRDAYRQGLVDACDHMCEGCDGGGNSNLIRETWFWVHPEVEDIQGGTVSMKCKASAIRDAIAAFDKESSNGTETK